MAHPGGEQRPVVGDAYATVVPSREVAFDTPIASTIRKVLVSEGDRVAEGQPLIELDSDIRQIAVALLRDPREAAATALDADRANLALKEQAKARSAKMHQQATVSEADFAQATFKADAAKSQCVLAELELEIQKLELQRATLALKQMTLRRAVCRRCRRRPPQRRRVPLRGAACGPAP